MFAKFRVKLSDSKTGNFLILALCVFFEHDDKLLAFHVIEGDINIMGLFAHNLHDFITTLSLTQPPATRITVVSCSACLYYLRVPKSSSSCWVSVMPAADCCMRI